MPPPSSIYGLVVERMRFAPPLVMLALGGMTLAFTAAALWRMIDPLARVELPEDGRRPRAAASCASWNARSSWC